MRSSVASTNEAGSETEASCQDRTSDTDDRRSDGFLSVADLDRGSSRLELA